MDQLLKHPAPIGDFLLRAITAPACLLPEDLHGAESAALISVDIAIVSGKIASITRHGAGQLHGSMVVDLDGGMVLPTLVDLHTHLDKGHIWPRKPNPDGTFPGALAAVGEDRLANWSADDVRARMEFGLKCAYAHGTSALRTHIDSIPPQDSISWPVVAELRQDWNGRVDLQAACLFGIDRVAAEAGFIEAMAGQMAKFDGVLGAVTYMIPDLDHHLDRIVRAAIDQSLSLDFHVDETLDPAAVSLRRIAEAVLRNGYDGKVVCGHCCSLSQHADDKVNETLDLVARAGIGVVSLPLCNMYLQDRYFGRTPRQRGVTLLHEMKARGIPVAVASDNTRDPFYAYGDLDLIEIYTQATRILQLDHPFGDWVRTVSDAPARLMGVEHGRLRIGGPADMMVFSARNWSELHSRPHGPRAVLRSGVVIDQTLPDYRELDHLMTVGTLNHREAAQ